MSREHDSKIAERIFKRNNLKNISCLRDKGYDSEPLHEIARKNGIDFFAPVRKMDKRGFGDQRPKGFYRRKCKENPPRRKGTRSIVENEQVGANVLYEVCDSLSSFPKFLRDVAKSRPNDLDFEPQFFVYARAVDLVRNPDIVKYFQDIGVFRANIGLESFSNPILKHMKSEGDSVEKNYQSLQMLKDAGIHVYGSLVLGSEVETPQTLRETIEGARRIIEGGLVADIEAQPVLPLPNNVYGRKLYESRLFPGGNETDWPVNTDEVSKIYIDNFSGISHRQAIEAAREIRGYARAKGINLGSGVSKESQYSE